MNKLLLLGYLKGTPCRFPGCGKKGEKRCGSCKSLYFGYYCSVDCQKRDWPNHKTFCHEQKQSLFNHHSCPEMETPQTTSAPFEPLSRAIDEDVEAKRFESALYKLEVLAELLEKEFVGSIPVAGDGERLFRLVKVFPVKDNYELVPFDGDLAHRILTAYCALSKICDIHSARSEIAQMRETKEVQLQILKFFPASSTLLFQAKCKSVIGSLYNVEEKLALAEKHYQKSQTAYQEFIHRWKGSESEPPIIAVDGQRRIPLEALKEAEDDLISVYCNLATIRLLKKNYDGAISILKLGLKQNPHDKGKEMTLVTLLSRLYWSKGQKLLEDSQCIPAHSAFDKTAKYQQLLYQLDPGAIDRNRPFLIGVLLNAVDAILKNKEKTPMHQHLLGRAQDLLDEAEELCIEHPEDGKEFLEVVGRCKAGLAKLSQPGGVGTNGTA